MTTVAIDQWVKEIYAADSPDLTPDEILASIQDLCAEFGIPEDVGKQAVARALAAD